MTGSRLQVFFGDDWDETLDSLKSAPGALGNLFIGVGKQVKAVDVIALGIVIAGWAWLIAGLALGQDVDARDAAIALLPTLFWLLAGTIAGLIFEIEGVGPRILVYWESYVLLLFFAVFGSVSVRLAFNPKDRRVYRGSAGRDSDEIKVVRAGDKPEA